MIRSQYPMNVAFANIRNYEELTWTWKNFVDLFHERPNVALIEDEPELLTETLQDGGLADAFLASIAGYLCQVYSLKQPSWPDQKPRIKPIPWFASDSPEMKAYFLRKSPAAFRVRNLFVAADILSVLKK